MFGIATVTLDYAAVQWQREASYFFYSMCFFFVYLYVRKQTVPLCGGVVAISAIYAPEMQCQSDSGGLRRHMAKQANTVVEGSKRRQIRNCLSTCFLVQVLGHIAATP